MKRALSLCSWGLVGLGVAAIVASIAFPLEHPRKIYLGLALLALAFVVRLVKQYLMRAPWPSRGGALVEASAHPIAYQLSFFASVALMGLIVWVLLRGYIAA